MAQPSTKILRLISLIQPQVGDNRRGHVGRLE